MTTPDGHAAQLALGDQLIAETEEQVRALVELHHIARGTTVDRTRWLAAHTSHLHDNIEPQGLAALLAVALAMLAEARP